MSPTIVSATSVKDYLDRYYKQDRRASVDNAYGAETLQRFYEIDFEAFGFVHTSGFDNVTGKHIAWPEYREVADPAVWARYRQMRDALQAEIDAQRRTP